jgi:hypothetical protein
MNPAIGTDYLVQRKIHLHERERHSDLGVHIEQTASSEQRMKRGPGRDKNVLKMSAQPGDGLCELARLRGYLTDGAGVVFETLLEAQ